MEYFLSIGISFLVAISFGSSEVPTAKIAINLPRTYEKLPWRTISVQRLARSLCTDRQRFCYFHIRILFLTLLIFQFLIIEGMNIKLFKKDTLRFQSYLYSNIVSNCFRISNAKFRTSLVILTIINQTSELKLMERENIGLFIAMVPRVFLFVGLKTSDTFNEF